MEEKRMMRALMFTTLVLTAFSALGSGCSSEDYFCDDSGCYYCDGLGCRPVDPPDRPPCVGDYECPAGTACTDLGCVGECTSDDECEMGTECRSGSCVAPTEPIPVPNPGVCTTNDECLASGLVCLDGVCTPDDSVCSADTDCAAGELCISGECLADDERCQFDHECGEGRSCINSECVTGCTDASSCDAGFMCLAGVCTPPITEGCTSNAACGGDSVCVDGACRPECAVDTDCGDGFRCSTAGACVVDTRPRPFCSNDSECMEGRVCRSGVCRTPCETSEQCRRFDVQFNVCSEESLCITTNEATSDCATQSDCLTGQSCSDGICR